MYNLDGNHVLCGTVTGNIVADVKGKCGVAVMMFADQCAVYIDVCIVVNTVKIQYQRFACKLLRQSKGLSVPSGTTWKESAFRFPG